MKHFLYGVAIVGILFCPLSGTRKVHISEAPNIQFSIGNPSVVLCFRLYRGCPFFGRSVERGPTVKHFNFNNYTSGVLEHKWRASLKTILFLYQ